MSKISLPLVGTNYSGNPKYGVVWTRTRENIKGETSEDPRIDHGKLFKNRDVQIRWYTDPIFRSQVTKSDNNYRYEIVDKSVIYNTIVTRSSYIPYITVNDDVYWLLGSFIDFPEIKVDFGGKCTKKEKVINCAYRELREETAGVLNEPIKRALKKNRVTVYKGTNRLGKSVIFMMVNMNYNLDDLDLIQESINETEKLSDEEFGPLDFYKEDDVLKGYDSETGERILTSFNLTDFVSYLRRNRAKRHI